MRLAKIGSNFNISHATTCGMRYTKSHASSRSLHTLYRCPVVECKVVQARYSSWQPPRGRGRGTTTAQPTRPAMGEEVGRIADGMRTWRRRGQAYRGRRPDEPLSGGRGADAGHLVERRPDEPRLPAWGEADEGEGRHIWGGPNAESSGRCLEG